MELPDLADNGQEWDDIYTDIARQLLEGEDLNTDALYKKTAAQLIAAMNNGFGGTSFDDDDSRKALQSKFIQNIEQFSYAKTLTQFHLFKDYVFNDKGQKQSFETVRKAVADTGEVFNNNYLRAEHQFVTQSAIMAHKWETLDSEYLEFTTVGDSHVRASHKLFDKFTALKTDPIWRRLYTPLDWGCRCTVIPGVAKNLSTAYNSDWANKTVDPLVKGTIFDNNAALTGVVFNKDHPYFKVDEKKTTGTNKPTVLKELKTTEDASDFFANFAIDNPEMFHRGFKALKTTKRAGVNGYTDMNGTIHLKEDITKEVISGLNNIRNGKKTTFAQEKALSTMHHEIMHNANKPGIHYSRMLTAKETQTMELANEFVSRKTLPEFMKNLGGKLENPELTSHRDNTGYNTMVRNYDRLIKFMEADEKKVLINVKDYLINGNYTSQIDGLIGALSNNSSIKLKKATMVKFIDYAKKLPEEQFNNLLINNESLKTKMRGK